MTIKSDRIRKSFDALLDRFEALHNRISSVSELHSELTCAFNGECKGSSMDSESERWMMRAECLREFAERRHALLSAEEKALLLEMALSMGGCKSSLPEFSD